MDDIIPFQKGLKEKQKKNPQNIEDIKKPIENRLIQTYLGYNNDEVYRSICY